MLSEIADLIQKEIKDVTEETVKTKVTQIASHTALFSLLDGLRELRTHALIALWVLSRGQS